MMDDHTRDEILAEVRIAPARRWLGVGMIGLMAVIVLYVAFATPPDFGWQVFLIVVGGASIWLAERMRRATELSLQLTREVLRDSSGTVLARVDEIDTIDRGMFAFKPSNGALLTLRRPAVAVWRPGLWWRVGRRLGLGGVTVASETKAMLEILSALQLERQQ